MGHLQMHNVINIMATKEQPPARAGDGLSAHKMGSYLLTIRREDLTIFLLGQLLTKMKDHFVLNNWKLISNAMCKEPQLFSQDYFLVKSATLGFQI